MKALSLLAVLMLTSSAAQAQKRLDMPELGVSVEIPAAWKHAKSYKATDHLPVTGLYHLMNLENGQGISVRRDECLASERRNAWVEGKLAEKLAWNGDILHPLARKAAIRFGDHKGFEMTGKRGNDVWKAYVFYLAQGEHCFEVKLSSPEELFAQSGPVFQQLVNSISFDN